ncbi:uncharacterized protein [Physcomitrium patens]|uniref:Uncharacterized protein n=1 Tax=Physcomitrium patens TaxID=3218 RepID=A0A2K1KI95_PHYPA|nr:uncharacterized protein LOC112282215 [Physcomitrium patens]PNR53504.1 hypothetical protein PHYPA_007179 [Physcomitrium patens]|eukprot:XP_024375353.1 uncharacterized protein LOC112282215 [Physcomitrella patens]
MVATAGSAVSMMSTKDIALPALAGTSSQAHLSQTTPSSLLVTAAVGNLRPSLRLATKRVIRNPANSKHVRSITHTLASSSQDTQKTVDIDLPEISLKSDAGDNFYLQRALLTATASFAPLLLSAQDAYAAGGEYGILEGRTLALIHPVVMLAFFVATGWAGYLGWQWRRVRTIQDEINELKKQVPAAVEGAPPSPVEGQIKELTETRKALVKGGFRERHFNWGSILLGGGVLFSVSGALNTYLRTGKLFPGPHLYAGAGITVLWALAAALVPPMQKGNETARSLHIALNTVNLLLFAWQIPTGWEIVLKVLEFTKFP